MGFKPESSAPGDPGASPESAGSAVRPMRADARRNRDRLIEVAAQVFASRGVDAPLEDIARQADVGIGTLYRHFPTREHLVAQVYRREVEGLCAAAEALGRELAPDAALAAWMQRFVDYVATKRGLGKSLHILKTTNAGLFTDVTGRMTAALSGLVEAAVAAGTIRADADVADLLHALSSLFSLPDSPDWEVRARRITGLFMDGLRRQPPG